jgi:uncharacterized protein
LRRQAFGLSIAGQAMDSRIAIDVPASRLEEFCRRHSIRRLSFFGSVVRDDFNPQSDVDVLVEFDPAHVPGLMSLAGFELELEQILGRRVDLLTPGFFRPSVRRAVLEESVVLYDESR